MRLHRQLVSIAGLAFVIVLALAACHRRPAQPTFKAAVQQALQQNGLGSVTVDEDVSHNTITLGGKTQNEQDKDRAYTIAGTAAPARVIVNQISVEPAGEAHRARQIESDVDAAIRKNFKAVLLANRLERQHIQYSVKNGVLTLSGTVDSPQLKDDAQQAASSTPNVQQVVNELKVRP